jgi:hypothetical protein
VIPAERQQLDPRDAARLLHELRQRSPGYVCDADGQCRCEFPEQGPGTALAHVAARYLHAVLKRLNQVPEKNKLAFLDLLGVDLIPAQAARAVVVFQLGEQAPPGAAPARTQVAAPPPPDGNGQIVFETERRLGLTPARIREVVSLWPGRDEFIDHSEDFTDGRPFRPYDKSRLKPTPHALYIAHGSLLALSGDVTLRVEFELSQPSNEHLKVVWEYWDGAIWRGFLSEYENCRESGSLSADGTAGFTRSGTVTLKSECTSATRTTVHGIDSFWLRGRLDEPLPQVPDQILPEITQVRLGPTIVRHETSELKPDAAFSGAQPLDLSNTFYPLGQAPQLGTTFYFTSEEAFSKPRAKLKLHLTKIETPQDQMLAPDPEVVAAVEVAAAGAAGRDEPLRHDIVWEYWNGHQWTTPVDFRGGTTTDPLGRFDGIVELTVPDDMAETEVNGTKSRWMRVRLVSGTYGLKKTVSVPVGVRNRQPVLEHVAYIVYQPPALSEMTISYVWEPGLHFADHVLAYNDFQNADESDTARWPGTSFQPFRYLSDSTPALYLGLDKPLPVDRVGLFFNVAEERDPQPAPELEWEYSNGINWERLPAEDGTCSLSCPGVVSLIGPQDAAASARFGTSRYWLRGRMKEDGPPNTLPISAVHLNAVWAAQCQTIVNEPIGASDGSPRQSFRFPRFPVLDGEQIEVRELAGQIANVEWRLLAREVLAGDERAIAELERQLADENPQVDVERGPLRLRRDRSKRVVEAWVEWSRREHLLESPPNGRHYLLDRATGRLQFGNGRQGKIPPMGSLVRAKMFRTGGGAAGNVAAGTVSQLLGGLSGVESVFNPLAAEGGADGESTEQFSVRGPGTIRHLGAERAAGDGRIVR